MGQSCRQDRLLRDNDPTFRLQKGLNLFAQRLWQSWPTICISSAIR
jgi:hypothetical protein